MNSVNLLGRLTAEPELRQTPNGTAVCSFGIAVNKQYKNRDGNYDADFINCVAWRQTGEFISRYFSKGDMMGLSGSIQTRTYQDKDTGKNRTAFEVLVNNAYFAGSKKESNNSGFKPAQGSVKVEPESFSTGSLDDFAVISTTDGDLPF